MGALAAVLLALLLCRPPGGGQVQGDQDTNKEEEDYYKEQAEEYKEEEEDEDKEEEGDEDEEAGLAGSRGRGLQCYACQALHQADRCNQMHRCTRSQPFCKTFVSQGDIESGPLTTYSAWCADTCNPVTRTVEGTLMTVTCCQTSLCNLPPWQGQPGSAAGGPEDSADTVAAALLLSLGLGVMGS